MDITILEKYGIDYKNGLARCMGDVEFYEKLLTMFLNDDTFSQAKKAFDEKNYEKLFHYTHELKGVCGNADMKDIYRAVCPLVELLRYNEGSEEIITEMFEKVEEAYNKAKEGIFVAIN